MKSDSLEYRFESSVTVESSNQVGDLFLVLISHLLKTLDNNLFTCCIIASVLTNLSECCWFALLSQEYNDFLTLNGQSPHGVRVADRSVNE